MPDDRRAGRVGLPTPARGAVLTVVVPHRGPGRKHEAYAVTRVWSAVTFGHDGSFDRDTVEGLLRACRPTWHVESFRPVGEGTDAVYDLTVGTPDGTREVVLKACEFLDPPAFRPEPVLLDLFAPTPVPVPEVLGAALDDSETLPTPCFLMAHRDGRTVEVATLPSDALGRLAREAGRHLGHVHTTGEFDRFGPVRLGYDLDHDRTGVAADGTRLAVDGGHRRWRERIESMVGDRLADVEQRFADLRDPLRRFIQPRLDSLRGPFDPALVHHDYRPGNLLVDPATGATHAVLDWGNPFTSERAFNLVKTESHLCGRVPPGHPRRKHVRASMRVGYAEVTGLPSLPERRRELYLAVTHLPALGWFSEWHADATEAERERDAERYREFVRALVADS